MVGIGYRRALYSPIAWWVSLVLLCPEAPEPAAGRLCNCRKGKQLGWSLSYRHQRQAVSTQTLLDSRGSIHTDSPRQQRRYPLRLS